MTNQEFEQVKQTFPWTERVIQTRVGGVVQVIDRFGNEVPIFTMVNFLALITAKLANTVSPAQPENKEAA